MTERLYRVENPYFVAGYVVSRVGRVCRTAPILRKHVYDKREDEALVYCRRRRWRVALVTR